MALAQGLSPGYGQTSAGLHQPEGLIESEDSVPTRLAHVAGNSILSRGPLCGAA